MTTARHSASSPRATMWAWRPFPAYRRSGGKFGGLTQRAPAQTRCNRILGLVFFAYNDCTVCGPLSSTSHLLAYSSPLKARSRIAGRRASSSTVVSACAGASTNPPASARFLCKFQKSSARGHERPRERESLACKIGSRFKLCTRSRSSTVSPGFNSARAVGLPQPKDRFDMRGQALLADFGQVVRQQQYALVRLAAELPAHGQSPFGCPSGRKSGAPGIELLHLLLQFAHATD